MTIFWWNQRRIEHCCTSQGGALCDNSYRLPAINYHHKELHLRCCSSPRSASGNNSLSERYQEPVFCGYFSKYVFLKISPRAVFKACNLIKKGLLHRCFPVNFANFLKAQFLLNTSGRLLLPIMKMSFLLCKENNKDIFRIQKLENDLELVLGGNKSKH